MKMLSFVLPSLFAVSHDQQRPIKSALAHNVKQKLRAAGTMPLQKQMKMWKFSLIRSCSLKSVLSGIEFSSRFPPLPSHLTSPAEQALVQSLLLSLRSWSPDFRDGHCPWESPTLSLSKPLVFSCKDEGIAWCPGKNLSGLKKVHVKLVSTPPMSCCTSPLLM